MSIQGFLRLILVTFVWICGEQAASSAEMSMGFRVGEVTQTSAIVWTRVSREKQRVWNGHREPMKRSRKQDKYTPSTIKIQDREGEAPGQVGQVRVTCSRDKDFTDTQPTEWVTVKKENDYVHQFRLSGLQAGTKHFLKVEARDTTNDAVSAVATGSFGTPAFASDWQDVRFSVVTGQSYWDLDHKDGYHMYPAMRKLNLDFIVPTGDTVYLDSEAPRARTVALARYHWHRMYSLPRHIEFHSLVPGYWEVDDHDSWCNDCWPTMQAAWMNPLTFRRGFEIYREQVPMGDVTYRTIRWGQGLQIWMVEGRLYRSSNRLKDSPEKSIWGREQMAWIKRTVLASEAEFRVLISPTPIVGPDRSNKKDNHANAAFAYEGNDFRQWTQDNQLKNFYTCCGDRHWQYMSIAPKSRLREFSCGPASDMHAGGSPGHDPSIQPFHRQLGGFLTVSVFKQDGTPTVAFRHHDVHGAVVHEFTAKSGG